jgi:RNA polymerase sigma-70 factor (ECF subfamily)
MRWLAGKLSGLNPFSGPMAAASQRAPRATGDARTAPKGGQERSDAATTLSICQTEAAMGRLVTQPPLSLAREIELAARGDEQAFAVIWRTMQPILLRYLRVVAADSADDLASETWLEVARDLPRFSGDDAGFRSWVFTIARHRAIDLRRRQARRPVEPLPTDLLPDLGAPDDPAASAIETLSTEAALAMIARLPADQAEAVMLRAVVGLDVAEAAAVMGKRPGTVRVLAHRGLRSLATMFPAPRGATS